MGCDIHAHIEYRRVDRVGRRLPRRGLPSWRQYASLNVNRNYALFSVLANVRNERGNDIVIEPVSMPKELPVDLSWAVKDEFERHWKADAHSCSWLSLEDLRRAQEIYAKVELPGESWEQPADSPVDDDVRVTGERVSLGLTRWIYCERGVRKPLGKNAELESVIAMMQALESGGRQTRLVFWFDN